MKSIHTDVIVVGAGPAGLAAALELKRLGVVSVTVLEREAEAGGVPRHCHHTGFGWFDLRRVLSGPAYARLRAEKARDAGVDLRTNTTALGWTDRTTLEATSPDGLLSIKARAVLLATGCRERPRSARLIPGDRPAGILTTGSLQQLVYLKKARIGARAVVVGAEHVSYSAVQTLWHGGAEVAAMVTDLPASQTYWPVRAYFGGLRRVPLITAATVARVIGKRRVEAIEVARAGAAPTVLPCDTVVFTGDWIPDSELARHGSIVLDPGTRGPAVDTRSMTNHPGVFAAGNAVHAAEMADVAALGGIAAARSVRAYLVGSDSVPLPAGVPFMCTAPIAWIWPNAIAPGATAPPLGRYLLRVSAFVSGASLRVVQDGKTLHAERPGRLVPSRSIPMKSGWEHGIDDAGGALTLTIDAG